MRKKIKVAMIASPFGLEGGPEVVCRHLTNALIDKDINVTLFAPGDWKTKAKHIQTLPTSLWKMKNFEKQSEFFRKNLIFTSQLKILEYQKNFDIVHIHSQRSAYTVAKLLKKPSILTLHNVISPMDLKQIKETGIHPIAISIGRKKKIKNTSVIENGIFVNEIKHSLKKGNFLLAIGRIIEAKGIDIAIRIAKKADKKLVIIGRIGNSPQRQEYYKKRIRPFLDKNIILKNQVSQKTAYDYMRNAEAIISPIRGKLTVTPLVIMEALASGTPVISTPIYPTPKYAKNKKIGVFSNNFNVLVKAAKNTDKFDRRECRKCAETFFDSSLMAEKYIAVYQKILKKV